MMGTFSDKALADLGMNLETVQKYRDYVNRVDVKAEMEKDRIQD